MSAGRWAAFREKDNKRGDEASIEARARTIDMVGLLPDAREPPWFFRRVLNREHADLLHAATLYADGARRSFERDIHKRNRQVQLTIRMPIEGCSEYNPCMSVVAKIWLIDYGNLVNGENTEKTILESWRSTKRIDEGFSNLKGTMAGLSQHQVVIGC